MCTYLCTSCGKEITTQKSSLKKRTSSECRVCSNRTKAKNNTTHGDTKTRLYSTYWNMKRRVSGSTDEYKRDYLDRGIRIDDEFNTYEKFKKWAISNGYSEDLELDRIDNDDNYCISNCRWTTDSVQSRNTRMLYRHNTTGFRGVSKAKTKGKYTAVIKVNSKAVYLGTHKTKEDAAMAYNKYVLDNNLEHGLNII